jgi:uncharacterized membrane protein
MTRSIADEVVQQTQARIVTEQEAEIAKLRAALEELISAIQEDCDEVEHHWLYEQVEKARKALANEQEE